MRSRAPSATKESPIPRIPHIRAAAFVSAVLALLVFVSPSFAALAAPTLTGPAASVTVDALPTFTWTGVSGADHYVFQLGGSTGFNPPQYTRDHQEHAHGADERARERALQLARCRGQRNRGAGNLVDDPQLHRGLVGSASAAVAGGRRHADLSPADAAQLDGRSRRAGIPAFDRERPADEHPGRRLADHHHRQRLLHPVPPDRRPVLVAGHAGRRRGQPGHAVGRVQLQLVVAEHHHADAQRPRPQLAGVRSAVLVDGHPGCGLLQGRRQHRPELPQRLERVLHGLHRGDLACADDPSARSQLLLLACDAVRLVPAGRNADGVQQRRQPPDLHRQL